MEIVESLAFGTRWKWAEGAAGEGARQRLAESCLQNGKLTVAILGAVVGAAHSGCEQDVCSDDSTPDERHDTPGTKESRAPEALAEHSPHRSGSDAMDYLLLTPLRTPSCLVRASNSAIVFASSDHGLASLATAAASTRSTCPVVPGLKPELLRHTPLERDRPASRGHLCLVPLGLACWCQLLHRRHTAAGKRGSSSHSARPEQLLVPPASLSCDYRSFKLFGGRRTPSPSVGRGGMPAA